MKINKNIIRYILSEGENYDAYLFKIATHSPSNGRLLAKLLYYKESVWEPKEKPSSVLMDGDVSKALTSKRNTKLKTADTVNDRVIPFVIILDAGTTELKVGDIYQVSESRVTGDAYNPEFLAMADMIKKNRKTADGKILLEGVKTPKEKIEALERNWGLMRIAMPWFEWDEETQPEDYLFYELPTPEIKSKINLEKLKTLLDD